jgi:hypothetical protein
MRIRTIAAGSASALLLAGALFGCAPQQKELSGTASDVVSQAQRLETSEANDCYVTVTGYVAFVTDDGVIVNGDGKMTTANEPSVRAITKTMDGIPEEGHRVTVKGKVKTITELTVFIEDATVDAQ